MQVDLRLARRARRHEKLLRPIRANVGIEAAYRRKLVAVIDEMSDSVEVWLPAAMRRNPARAVAMAADESPMEALQREIQSLAERWIRQIDAMAPKLAEWFSFAVGKRSSAALRQILRDAGFTIEFQMTDAMLDVLAATVAQNVALIRSIPRQYFLEIEGMAMRAVQAGQDLGPFAKELRARYGVTKRRAAFIARDQSNKATASLTRVRQLEAGLTEAVWYHSHAGKTPRPSHAKAGREGVHYDIRKGWFDPHEQKFIQPGELINCRCFGRPVLPGMK